MQIIFQSDTGKKRSINQDYVNYFINQSRQPLMVLCDGMGGHKAGDVASEMAVSHMGEAWKSTSFKNGEELSQWIITTIQKVNDLILRKSLEFSDLEGMGTTLVVAAYISQELFVANIGDSRAYLYRNFKLKQITEDHSLVNELIKSGEITEEEAVHHPRKNILTRSVGVANKIEVDIVAIPVADDDILLLCSDGLTNMLSDEEISKVLKEWMPLKEKASILIKNANESGGIDNVSVLLAEFLHSEEDVQWK